MRRRRMRRRRKRRRRRRGRKRRSHGIPSDLRRASLRFCSSSLEGRMDFGSWMIWVIADWDVIKSGAGRVGEDRTGQDRAGQDRAG